MQHILIKHIFKHTKNNIIKRIKNISPWKNIDFHSIEMYGFSYVYVLWFALNHYCWLYNVSRYS